MSRWTYVIGALEVETCARTTPEALFLAQTVIARLPPITGSEGPAKFYATVPEGYNSSSNADEYGRFSNLGNYGGCFHAQTTILITVQGSLRDRVFDRTLKETVRALTRLSRHLDVSTCSVTVCGDSYGTPCRKTATIANPEWLLRSDVTDWAGNLIAWPDRPVPPAGHGPYSPRSMYLHLPVRPGRLLPIKFDRLDDHGDPMSRFGMKDGTVLEISSYCDENGKGCLEAVQKNPESGETYFTVANEDRDAFIKELMSMIRLSGTEIEIPGRKHPGRDPLPPRRVTVTE